MKKEGIHLCDRLFSRLKLVSQKVLEELTFLLHFLLSSRNLTEVCGGESTNSVYMTDIKVPGPAKNLTLSGFDMTSLSVQWAPPGGPKHFVKSMHVFVSLKKSFDPRVSGDTKLVWWAGGIGILIDRRQNQNRALTFIIHNNAAK